MQLRRRSQPAVVHTITTAPVSVAMDQDVRMKRYLVTMALRTVCFVLAVIFEGWLRWVFVAGAVVLPYVAVVLANAVGPRWGSRISGADRFAAPAAQLGEAPAGTTIIHTPRDEDRSSDRT